MGKPERLTLYQRHKRDWIECTRCHYHTTRSNVVIMRGKMPCDVLFLGEAPGESEDAQGEPFVGPAGHLLDSIIDWAVPVREPEVRLAFTNLVGCYPVEREEEEDKEGTKKKGKKAKAGEPDDEAIEACMPRVEEFVNRIARPKFIVCVGKLAKDWLEPGIKGNHDVPREIPRVHVTHPSAMLRAPAEQKDMWVRQARIRIMKACEEYL